jgi:hypothetical protein
MRREVPFIASMSGSDSIYFSLSSQSPAHRPVTFHEEKPHRWFGSAPPPDSVSAVAVAAVGSFAVGITSLLPPERGYAASTSAVDMI